MWRGNNSAVEAEKVNLQDCVFYRTKPEYDTNITIPFVPQMNFKNNYIELTKL